MKGAKGVGFDVKFPPERSSGDEKGKARMNLIRDAGVERNCHHQGGKGPCLSSGKIKKESGRIEMERGGLGGRERQRNALQVLEYDQDVQKDLAGATGKWSFRAKARIGENNFIIISQFFWLKSSAE